MKIGELLERSGTAVPYRTLARFAARECGYSSGRPGVTVRVDDPPPGRELQVDFGYLGMIPDGERRQEAARAGVHGGVLPVLLRLPDVPADDAGGDRGLRGGLGVLRGRVPCSDSRQPEAGGGRRGPAGAAVEPGVAGVRAGPRHRGRPGEGPLAAGQGAGRVRGEVHPAELLRRGVSSWTSATRSGGPTTGAGSGPGCGCTARPGCGRRRRSRSTSCRCCWRPRRSPTGFRPGRRPRCSAISMSARRTRSTRCLTG